MRSIRITEPYTKVGTKPQVFAFANALLAGAGNYDTDETYLVPSLADGSEEDLTVEVCSVVGSNPGATNFTGNFYDANIFVDSREQSVVEGFQDSARINRFNGQTNVTVFTS